MTPAVRGLRDADVAAAVELSAAAGWNQTADDWRMLLQFARTGCFGIDLGGHLAATTTLVDYDRQVGWIGMVLTNPIYRRRGLARTLMEHTLDQARALGLETLKLDATDQGRPLYEQLGFRAEQPIERWWRRNPLKSAALPNHRPLDAGSLSLDREASGLDRAIILLSLAARSKVFVCDDGFALLRPGVRCSYLGPCIATSAEKARCLVRDALSEAGETGCFWDILTSNASAVEIAREFGFEPQRLLVRMLRGACRRGREEFLYAIAGFEVG